MSSRKPSNTQLLNQLMQARRIQNFNWTPQAIADEHGKRWHKATFAFMGTQIATSNWHPTAQDAREEAAFHALTVVGNLTLNGVNRHPNSTPNVGTNEHGNQPHEATFVYSPNSGAETNADQSNDVASDRGRENLSVCLSRSPCSGSYC
jgi:hypothetical protein